MGSPFMGRAIAGHLPLKNSHLLSAVIVGLMVTGVQAADPEFKKERTMGLAMKKHISTECSVMWKSENGKTYCFGNEEAKSHFLKDKKGNLNQAEVF
jgi:YHS domain-containing protein